MRMESRMSMAGRTAEGCLILPCIRCMEVGETMDRLIDMLLNELMWARGDSRCTCPRPLKAWSHCLHGRWALDEASFES
jgi:hypothetical protein